MKPYLYSSAFAVLMCSTAWGNGVYSFAQISPVGQAINVNGGAAINTTGLIAWAYGNSIQTWNGSSVTTYNPGVNVATAGTNIGLSDAGGVSFTSFASGFASASADVYSIPGGTLTSFSFPGQSYTYFGGSSANGLVAGDYSGDAGFIWTGGTSYNVVNYPTAHGQIYLYDVNNNGDLIGLNACCGSGVSFIDVNNNFTTISVPGSNDNQVFAFGLNNSDIVVGDTFNGTSQSGFIWQNGSATALNYPGATDTIIYGVNSAGQLVGEADFGSYTNGIVFTATLAPEPGTFALLFGAAALLGAVRKYRSN
jgi:hypothetical protein